MYWKINRPKSYLMHYGVKGMRWGVRRTPKQLGYRIPKKLKASNLDKWGKNPDTNILYITGRSGSGKSSLAKAMSDSKTDVIHLDLYFEGEDIEFVGEKRSKGFDNFLKEKGLKSPGSEKAGTKAFGKALDAFEEALDQFGYNAYNKGRKVIVEGVQIAQEGGLQLDKSYYRNKPLIVVDTSNLTSSYRAMKRDNSNAKLFVRRILSEDSFNRESAELLKDVNISNGKEWIKQYLEEVGK